MEHIDTIKWAVVFTDIKDFTLKTSLLTQLQITKFLNKQDEIVLPIIVKYFWKVVKTIWDAYMIVFEKAENAVIEISKFLRNAINKESLITLETELSMVKTYVNIENVRFDEKIVLHIKDFSEFKNIRIPKFSIQLLVENAIKHGYLGKVLNININFSNDKIMVQNDGKIANIVKFGTGLSNLQKRLELQRVGDLEYKIEDKKMKFIIKIKDLIWKWWL